MRRPVESALITSVRVAEALRPRIEQLASDEAADVSIIAETRDWITFVALARGSHTPSAVSVGMQLPLLPPLGSVFVKDDGATTLEAWISRLPRGSEDIADLAREQVAKVQANGFSLSLLGDETDELIYQLANELADGATTPHREREITRLLIANFDRYEPAITAGRSYDVKGIVVPIPESTPGPRLALRFANPPREASASTVTRWIRRVQECAQSVPLAI
ncbi:MAG TPA: hypothetical protein GXZ30_01785 [Propionibacterium sp.]|nr:hypothetical protein [Propionibacterium sp.]